MWRLASLLALGTLVACGEDSGTSGNKDAANPPDDAPVMIDAPGTGADASFGAGALCGMATCATTQGCCTGAMISCKAEADCPTQFFACDGPEDCGGGTCCYGNGGQGGSTCQAAGGNCNVVACHFDSDCGGGTPKCCPRMFTPSYRVCAAAC